MKVIEARNVHDALPQGIDYLLAAGIQRGSRNGPVLVAPGPVTTVYNRPTERLTFWPPRDVNVAFLTYEALWMLAGRNDLAPLLRYVSTFKEFSDDGISLHGAYGYRWRHAGHTRQGYDQLRVIAARLAEQPDDRRCVLQIWDHDLDLASTSKDIPCNDLVTFQRDASGRLDMTVFCRSNDIIWGAYFANAFHFSVLHEYMAAWIGCPVGLYRQVSVNYHAYLDTLKPLADLPKVAFDGVWSVPTPIDDPYADARVTPPALLAEPFYGESPAEAIAKFDDAAHEVLADADNGFAVDKDLILPTSPFLRDAWVVLRAHEYWRMGAAPERFDRALDVLTRCGDPSSDLIAAMTRWVVRRREAWETKMANGAAV